MINIPITPSHSDEQNSGLVMELLNTVAGQRWTHTNFPFNQMKLDSFEPPKFSIFNLSFYLNIEFSKQSI